MKYRKKPIVIEAVQYWAGHEAEVIEFLGGYTENDKTEDGKYETDVAIFTVDEFWNVINITIKTLEGNMKVNDLDYVIKGVKGEFYPCKPGIFVQSYEIAEPNDAN